MFGKKNNNFSSLYTIVHVFLPSIFKCYSFIEYIDSIEYIVYLINTQRCRVPLYFTSCNIVISSVPDKGSLDIERFFTAKTTHISYSVHYFMTSRSLIQINTGPNPQHQMIKKNIQQKVALHFPRGKIHLLNCLCFRIMRFIGSFL